MAVVEILAISLALNLARTLLVVDAVLLAGRLTGAVALAARFVGSHTCTSPAPARSPGATRRQQARKGFGTAGSPKVRSLHLKLLAVHATASLAAGAALLQYALPVSATSCKVPHQFMIGFLLLFDASLVTFLLAKVDVTNGRRTLACWEKGAIWISRVYAWIYLPLAAVFVGITYEGGTGEEGTICVRFSDDGHEREQANNAIGYASNNGLLIAQFAVLLVLFLRPLLVMRHENTQSGGAVYRRVVIRNVVCTCAISITYLIVTVVEVLALLDESAEDDKASIVVVVAPVINTLLVLCLIEISLRLGFTSCWKAFATDSANSPAREVSPPVTAPEEVPVEVARTARPLEVFPVEP
ncbi:unnamed protein product [Pylaiella littoralis]